MAGGGALITSESGGWGVIPGATIGSWAGDKVATEICKSGVKVTDSSIDLFGLIINISSNEYGTKSIPTNTPNIVIGAAENSSSVGFYTKGTDVKGGKMQTWMPVDGADNFTPAGSNFEPIPKGYTRNLAHFHHKYPWLSTSDKNLLQGQIRSGILSSDAKIYAV